MVYEASLPLEFLVFICLSIEQASTEGHHVLGIVMEIQASEGSKTGGAVAG